MHPVAKGSGVRVSAAIPKWEILFIAKSIEDVKKNAGTRIFTTMFRAHCRTLASRPYSSGCSRDSTTASLAMDSTLMEQFRSNFYLETMTLQAADKRKSLRGVKFDWSRNDNYDHVYANQAFTHKLNELGISDEAEEYNGAFRSDWGVQGRI